MRLPENLKIQVCLSLHFYWSVLSYMSTLSDFIWISETKNCQAKHRVTFSFAYFYLISTFENYIKKIISLACSRRLQLSVDLGCCCFPKTTRAAEITVSTCENKCSQTVCKNETVFSSKFDI
jgi:hypothetical protein